MEISTLIEIVSLFSPLLVFLRSSCFLIAIADLAFAYTLFIHSICVFYCDLGIVFYPRYKMEKKTIITFIFIEFSKGYRHNQFIKNKLQPMKSYLSWIELESCHSCDWKKFNVPCCCSVIELCLTLWDPIDCSTQGFAVLHCLMCIELVMLSNHLILCCPPPLLFLLSVFPSIRVFSNESTLHIRWPKYWSFSFSISPYREYLGLICFRKSCMLSTDSWGCKESDTTEWLNWNVRAKTEKFLKEDHCDFGVGQVSFVP